MSKKRSRLITAVITITAFLSTSLYAGPATVRPAAAPSAFDINAFSLPAGLGEVSSVFKGTNGKTILHIQDAHCDYNAQHAIAAIIANLSANYNARIVFLEGGAGSYNFSAFDRIGDPAIKEKVSDYFVREGIVTGAEFFAINNPGVSPELYGIEDEGLYFKNLKAYRDSLAFKEEADLYLKTLFAAMNNLKLKAYSPPLKELDEKMAAYRGHKIDFKAYASYLKEKAEANNIVTARYENLSHLFATIRIESAINFKEAERERVLLINKLESVLPKGDLKELAKTGAEYKAGEIPSEAFYSYLFREAKIANVDFNALPNLVKYSEYLKTYESIDKAALLKEIKDVEQLIANRLAKTEDQRRAWGLDKDLNILKTIFNTSLIKEDFDYCSAHKEDFDVKNFTGFFIKRGPAYGLKFTPDERLNKLDIYRSGMEKFYAYSLRRDDAFLKNIGSKLAADNKNIAILVTGGFHSANLFKLFKDKGYSYAKLMPKFKADEGDNPYFNLLAGGMTPMQEFLKTAVSYTPEKAALAIETPFSQMAVEPAVKNLIEIGIVGLGSILGGKAFVMQTRTHFIVIDNNPVEGAMKDIKMQFGPQTIYASIFPALPANHTVNAMLLNENTMTWEPSGGIPERGETQGPPSEKTKERKGAPVYSQNVSVIRGKVGVGVGPQYAGEELIEAGKGEVIEGIPGEPFKVTLKTALGAYGQRYWEVPGLAPVTTVEGVRGLNAEMNEYDRAVLASLAARPLNPEKEYMVYIECPDEMRGLPGVERAVLQDMVTTHRIGNVTYVTFAPSKRDGIAKRIELDAARIGANYIVAFALKGKDVKESATDEIIKKNSYTVYMEGVRGHTYVPVRTCGMTALKIFDFLNLQEKAEGDKSILNPTVEMIARGLGLISGASYKDLIGVIASADDQGRLWLLKSGLILVEIRPFNINDMKLLNEMAKLVRTAV
ncbi:MAG: hypothetical protein NTW09_05055 [Candidatus Omnitrophica bacterium]|nr:hypothetical protein [Candidatus Omnitrophota bacterium]